jgi:hypothetical protein
VLAEYWGQFVQMRNDIAIEKIGNGEISFQSVTEEDEEELAEAKDYSVMHSLHYIAAESPLFTSSLATNEEAQTYVNNGSSIYIPKQGQVRLKFIPGSGEELLSATLDGEDITPYIVDNVYIATADKNNAKLVVKFSGDDNTAIKDISSGIKMKNAVYDLSGQLISINTDINSLPKGIYIVSGKKVIVK